MTSEKTKTFNFCQGQPPEDFFAQAKELNGLTSQQYSQLVDYVFVFLGDTDLKEELNNLLNTYSNDHGIAVENVKEMFKMLLILSQEASQSKLTSGQLYSDLQLLQINAKRGSQFCQAWKKNLETRAEINPAELLAKRLVDMEWKFGVTASSSELRRVGTCFIQLTLVVAKGTSTENVLLEMSLSQFYDFMHEMERAKLEMDAMT
uniref:COMM domain-containing protein 7-like n=1 Tax=Phallusia mammillata TaxID=59560 RepID=A0A6F9D975_9ASCI|nr:COMM domain-containing protein 7-like [Phallusia mammillata]